MSKNTKNNSYNWNRQNVYNVNLVETNGQFRVMDACKFIRVNQHGGKIIETNSRRLARELNRGKLVIK